jgi:glutaredoxin
MLLCSTSLVGAQTIYRSVGPDGRVTFSDHPQTPAAAQVAPSGSTGTGSGPTLPYELQQVVAKYPVTLYTASSCGPCDASRTLLTRRGVPFTEKTVNTNEDVVAFGRVSKENALPLMVLGGQHVKGFAEGEWHSYLDAAGYPRQSTLPAGYRAAAAQPLSPLKPASQAAPVATDDNGTAAAAAPVRRKATPPPPPRPAETNPAGIKF